EMIRRPGGDAAERAGAGSGSVTAKDRTTTRAARGRSSLMRRWWVFLAGASLLLLPMMALLAAGFVWLWERGWALRWLAAASADTRLVGLGLRVRHRPFRRLPRDDEGVVSEPDYGWAPKELEAWEEVRRLSLAADVSILKDRERMFDAARQTIAAVAAKYHP